MSEGGTVTLDFVLLRLDHIQTDLRLLRYRDEQREASHQAIATTLSRQMVELAMSVDGRLNELNSKLDETREALARIEQHLTREG